MTMPLTGGLPIRIDGERWTTDQLDELVQNARIAMSILETIEGNEQVDIAQQYLSTAFEQHDEGRV